MVVDWQAYERCPVCFRAYDCRTLRRSWKGYRYIIVPVLGGNYEVVRYVRRKMPASGGGWYDRSLKRPHRGRRKRGNQVRQT